MKTKLQKGFHYVDPEIIVSVSESIQPDQPDYLSKLERVPGEPQGFLAAMDAILDSCSVTQMMAVLCEYTGTYPELLDMVDVAANAAMSAGTEQAAEFGRQLRAQMPNTYEDYRMYLHKKVAERSA